MITRTARVLIILCALSAAGAAFAATGTGVWMGACGDRVILQNSRVRVDYDVSLGTYSITDIKDSLASITGAHLQVNELASNSVGLEHYCQSRSVKDALGVGRKLTVTTTGLGRPELVLDITLYKDRGFVVLAAGIDNITDKPIKVNYIDPLAGAVAYGRLNPKSDLRMLNGVSKETDGRTMECANNLLVTFACAGKRKSLMLGELTHRDFAKFAKADARGAGIKVGLCCLDKAGKSVDAGSRYVSKDKFYIDLTTPDKFEALAQYGLCVRTAASPLQP